MLRKRRTVATTTNIKIENEDLNVSFTVPKASETWSVAIDETKRQKQWLKISVMSHKFTSINFISVFI